MQTALVTGATSGIGRAMALALHRAGYRVLALGRSGDALASLAAEAPGIVTISADVTARQALAEALAPHRIDVLVANAGIMPPPSAFDRQEMADIDQTVVVNFQSVLWLARLVVPQMRKRKSGHVVLTGSSSAYAPGPNFAVYAATKAAIAAFATALRAEVSPDGIRVTELVPGRVETALYSQVLTEEAREAMYAGGMSLLPEDVAEAMLAVLNLPSRADITRLDIMPTRPVPPIKLK